ncbi:MAG: hypothetical protein ACJASN_001393 [Cyclobacteriaceae bacterium]|jgi:hypothetical protein
MLFLSEMKGVIFSEYLDFVENGFGYDAVDDIIASCDLASEGAYTSIGSYPFEELQQLLTQTCIIVDRSAEELLKGFGAHLFTMFVSSYGHFFEHSKSSFDILSVLDDHIHPEVLKLYPDAELPSFEVTERSDSHMVMVYKSTRKMSTLAEGLIESCMVHFKEEGIVKAEQLDEFGEIVRFTISRTAH